MLMLVAVVHGMLIATMATLVVELGLIVTLTIVVHLLLVLLMWVVHISHLLLLLTGCGLIILAALHNQL